MAHIRRVIRCQGCGAILQSDSKKLPGFISKSVIENGIPKIPYCNSCYEKMLALNSSPLEQSIDKDTVKILKDAVATDALIIWAVDLFAFNGTLNPDVVKKVKKLDVVVFGMKKDLFPALASEESLKRFIDERFSEYGINPVEIKLFGKEDEINTKAIMKKINELRKGRDIYLIGNHNSGKTTFITKLLQNYENKTKWQIKTEKYRDTEADVLEIPLSNSSFLYELPDLSNSISVFDKVEKEVQKIITPRKEIDMRRYFLGDGSTIVVGGLASLSILKGHHTSYRLFCAEKVESKVVSNTKAENYFMSNVQKRAVLKPVSKRFDSFDDFDMFEYDLDNDDLRHDIAIEGLCWFSMRGRGQTVRVTLPKGAALKETLSKVR